MSIPSRRMLITTLGLLSAAGAAVRLSSDPVADEPGWTRALDGTGVERERVCDTDRHAAMWTTGTDPLVTALTGGVGLREATRPLEAGLYIFDSAVVERPRIGRSVWVQVRLPTPLSEGVSYRWRRLELRCGLPGVDPWPWTQDYRAQVAADTSELLAEVSVARGLLLSLEPTGTALFAQETLGDPQPVERRMS